MDGMAVQDSRSLWAAASLKQNPLFYRSPYTGPLPQPLGCGLTEAGKHRRIPSRAGLLPQPLGCGLIEASLLLGPFGLFAQLPQPLGCGLIEACRHYPHTA